jgi:hypothetical protein
MKSLIVCLGAVLFSSLLLADEKAVGLVTPPFFTEALRAQVDNSKGATLTVKSESSRINGASITIPAGALNAATEEVVLSFSDKLPGLPLKPADGMSFVQNSQIFAVQTTSRKLKKNISLILPYYNEQAITAAGTRVVMFNLWNSDANSYDTLEAHPVPGRISFAKVQTKKIHPEVDIVSLRLAQSPGFETVGKSLPAPKGWKSVPNSDSCIKIDGPKLISPAGSPEQLFEASFANSCDYPIQASACQNKNGLRGCPLPKAITMPPHSEDMLTLSGFSTKDMSNLGACRVTLADGTPVTYDLILSSNPASNTVCLVKKDGGKK